MSIFTYIDEIFIYIFSYKDLQIYTYRYIYLSY